MRSQLLDNANQTCRRILHLFLRGLCMYAATEAHFALFISLRFSENFREIKSAKRASADQ